MDMLKEYKKINRQIDFENVVVPFFKTSILMSVPPIAAQENKLNDIYILYALTLQCNFIITAIKNMDRKRCEMSRRVTDVLMTTDMYKELKYEYDSLLTDIAIYLKSKNIKSSKEIVLYLQKMIDSSGLSFMDEYRYYGFKYEYDDTLELLGSRVMTGLSVCRHNASFMTDVMNRYGYSSYKVPVYDFDKNKTPIWLAKNRISKHLISAIIDENGKYAYDPTNKCFVSSSKMYDDDILYDLNRHYYLNHICKNTEKWHNEYNGNYKQNSILPFEQINENEIREIEREIESLYIKEDKINQEFYKDEALRITKIASLNSKVFPFSNKKIKSWELK